MKKFVALGPVVVLLVLAAVALAAPAGASGRFSLSVDRRVLHSGEVLTVTARAVAPCGFAVRWNGESRGGAGTSLVASFTAPRVAKVTRIRVHGTCFATRAAHRAQPSARAAGATERLRVTVPTSVQGDVVITVLPPGVAVSPPGTTSAPGLPNTGGPTLLLVLLGLGSVLVGAGVVGASRRSPSAF